MNDVCMFTQSMTPNQMSAASAPTTGVSSFWATGASILEDLAEQGYELPEAMDRNLYHLGAGERRRLGVEPLPESLGDAIELTADSELPEGAKVKVYVSL